MIKLAREIIHVRVFVNLIDVLKICLWGLELQSLFNIYLLAYFIPENETTGYFVYIALFFGLLSTKLAWKQRNSVSTSYNFLIYPKTSDENDQANIEDETQHFRVVCLDPFCILRRKKVFSFLTPVYWRFVFFSSDCVKYLVIYFCVLEGKSYFNLFNFESLFSSTF